MCAGGAGSSNFSTDCCKFLTDDVVGGQHYNFAQKFPLSDADF